MANAERSAPSAAALGGRGGAADHVKVLFVSHTDGVAGAERILLEIVASLRGTRYEPLVTVTGEGLLKRELEALGAKVYIRPVERWIPYKPFHTRWHLRCYLETLSARVRGIVDVIEREQVAIVHSNVGGALEGALAACLTGRPHVWHQHSTYRGDPDRGPWTPRLPLGPTRVCVGHLRHACRVQSGHARTRQGSGLTPILSSPSPRAGLMLAPKGTLLLERPLGITGLQASAYSRTPR